ncbi:MAG: hypothetical protein UT06_C0002G0001 [Candidatus Woesebacteria bacterium GW2011_GWA1_38_8]|uniref:Uncharacterized protein n=1 Tax=Candidatus Woesebacteria bacterium GW2011_GWA1_38_8 TaxID=1618547 RepID=A0A0G0KYA6_9BACT|nr:MAG: hypothetical protein UT06_C0002G0001 [Candidatus Woesebacteria bacterium GW2011_GWA1_38_8]
MAIERNMFPEQNSFQNGQEQQGAQQEQQLTPELLRQMDTRELYTVPGGIRIVEFREALHSGDTKKIQSSLEKSLAWIEGVTNGIDAKNYGIYEFTEHTDDDREIVDLKNMFESVETSIDRPNAQYLTMAIEDALETTIEKAQVYRDNSAVYVEIFKSSRKQYYQNLNDYYKKRNEEEHMLPPETIEAYVTAEANEEKSRMDTLSKSLKDIKGLRHHYDARTKVFEPLFVFSQRTCEDESDWMELSKRSPKPDKVKNDGSEISDGYDVYTNGFRTTVEFVSWAKAILPYTNIGGVERIDVLFAAWKQATIKGTLSRLSWGVKETQTGSGVYEYNFGNPPFSNDIRGKLIHSDKYRAKEWGWCANNSNGEIVDLDEWVLRDKVGRVLKRMTEQDYQSYVQYAQNHRTKPYKAISNSGHPLSIGRIGKVLDDYESYTTIRLEDFKYTDADESSKELPDGKYSLHDLVYRYGISRSSPDFPWSATEIKTGKEAAGEPPHNTWGAYHLNTIRGEDIRTASQRLGPHIREIADANRMTSGYFESSTMRNWEKVKKLLPGQLVNGVPKNPFAWKLLGDLRAGVREKYTPDWMVGEIGYRTMDNQNKINNTKVGESASGAMSISDILSNAMRIGVISTAESNWIYKQLVD